MLISHDQTKVSMANALRALWMTSLGGAAFILALVWIYLELRTLDLHTLIQCRPGNGALLLPLALLCLAGFTKAAQMPFQSWLLGAMVAPTPTSALLHSSTMVKAGVYLVLRLSPAFTGTFLSTSLGLYGAFTFVAAAALAVGQHNGKKILAYSTISNLGLIFACTGLNTSASITAAMFLIIYHAFSKALLFLCVGTIEQQISSRDVEKMRGLFNEMPVTAVILVMGVLTMILPPFGMLLGKWMAIESAAGNMAYIIILAMGSAMTTVYWAKWAGTIMDAPLGRQNNRGTSTPGDQGAPGPAAGRSPGPRFRRPVAIHRPDRPGPDRLPFRGFPGQPGRPSEHRYWSFRRVSPFRHRGPGFYSWFVQSGLGQIQGRGHALSLRRPDRRSRGF